MSNFVINEDDPVYIMRNNLEASLLAIKKEKYNLILEFINKLCCSKHTSLCKIKDICFSSLETKYVEQIIQEYMSKIKKKFSINIEKKYKGDCANYIYLLVNDMLKNIDYYLMKKKDTSNKTSYVIKTKSYSLPYY
jgi:hypothetical protein